MSDTLSLPTSENRRLHRIRTTFRVEPVSKKPSGEELDLSLRDISLEGVRLLSSQPLETGSRVRLRVPDIDDSPSVEGSVIWCHNDAGAECYDIGVRLRRGRTPSNERLFTQVREIEAYRRRAAPRSQPGASRPRMARSLRRSRRGLASAVFPFLRIVRLRPASADFVAISST
jgi:hypothetical protein